MNSPDVVNRLVSDNQGLVVHFAKLHKRLIAPRIGLAALISSGKIGLVEAAKRYDSAKGTKFSTYSVWWIRKYMFNAVKGKLPKTSLNAPIRCDGIVLQDAVADERARPASELVSGQETHDVFRRVMVDAGLDNREKEIISQRYGVDDGEQKTQKQIAKKLGLTRARVNQLEKIARGKIAKLTA